MDEQKTVRVDPRGSDASGGSTVYSGQRTGSYDGGGEQTQYADANRPTPRPDDVTAWQTQPPMPQQGAWGQPDPAAGGAQTMMIGPRAEPSFAWLVVAGSASPNPYLGQAVPLKAGGATTLGRVQGNDIIVPDPSCSSQHARVRQEADENGRSVFVIYDLASSNGLFIGSKETYKDAASRVHRHILKDGDYILIGETTLVFKQV
jgi:hypothetical protein